MSRSSAEIEDWIVTRLSQLLHQDRESIRVREPVARLGLDSVSIVVFAADLEEFLGVRLKSNPLTESITIEQLAKELANYDTVNR